MAVRFNKLVRPGLGDIHDRLSAGRVVVAKAVSETMVFMSHKTGDSRAEREADYIAERHGLKVYMAEWDDEVGGDSDEVPEHIMDAIRKSDGFLVNVTAAISNSMWIGYEVGGAHAMGKTRAKIMYTQVFGLPSVVRGLETLGSRTVLDRWIETKVL